ncbi:bifunctional diaminohydroxyphosphoribosylaminopyrimidine deaminase/5-amino-6-(5-phosphoribosylamino)uracil reductase RibD [Rathayibacter sp. VKM Ac-2759]|uniref:bifunctional diaminohydroxyphosphoribosylaminopyrimidine deaminase/5-amino-6-(5-phosphoribosylamino)uracil reductase RibD n=1 Tax=Rathayibacter sp. VKM Ac-2759 TaxID=2609252 RepID=UPI001FC8ED0F|nr:bifunctional diaminohydroxyphosphoribosylaminopyrimidine deaminase/5-amino-6-(5-phosphoribosylamino)uracil reductase RibD [Rathayibacter sp. VKM Ac-2759]
MTIDFEHAMRRALALAEHGPARGVNPRVGCVVLAPDGSTLAEGWHHGAGTAHAEVDALSALAPGAADGATAVVSLEPCNHTGRTGPCSRALIDAGITRVVYAVGDPGDRSSGGADTLRAAGVEVVEGVLAEEAEEFLHVWLAATRRRRPWVTLKWASTLDGRTAAADGSSRWITGTAARQRVHEQRATADAILVGTGTVLADDPSLTARGDGGELLADQPVPVVVGTRAIPAGARVLDHPRRPVLERTRDLSAVLDRLYDAEVRHVYVEGGPTLASALVAGGFVDEFLVYLAPALLGGPRLALDDLGVESIGGAHRLALRSVETLGDDLLVTARPKSVLQKES